MARLDAKWVKFGGASQTWDHFWQGTATAAIAGLIAVGSATLGFAGPSPRLSISQPVAAASLGVSGQTPTISVRVPVGQALYNVNRNLLATTSNDTTTAWAANTVKTLNLTAAYTVPYTGFYYLGIMVAATTVPTIKGHTAFTATNVHGLAPITNGTSSTGLTTALPNPAAAITVATTSAYGYVS